MKFSEYFELKEASRQRFIWAGQQPEVQKDANGKIVRDTAGFAVLSQPGFRATDKTSLIKSASQVKNWLNAATEHMGIHWLVIYNEPIQPDEPTTPNNYDPVAQGDRHYGWKNYKQRTQEIAEKELEKFISGHSNDTLRKGVPDINNTIVYVKSTSRVHNMDAWLAVHNIGHAIWGRASKYKEEFSRQLEGAVRILQQAAYEIEPNAPPPSQTEITVMMARLMGHKSLTKIWQADKPGQMDNQGFRMMTSMLNYDEFLFDLIASFLRNKGRLPIYPRADFSGDVSPIVGFQGATTVSQPRDWVWKKLASDKQAWQKVARTLEGIVYRALKSCTWGALGRPIYSTYGKLTTEF